MSSTDTYYGITSASSSLSIRYGRHSYGHNVAGHFEVPGQRWPARICITRDTILISRVSGYVEGIMSCFREER